MIKQDFYTIHNIKYVDYKDTDLLKKFVNPSGKIVNSRRSSLSAKHQRQVAQAIKRARFMGLMPYIAR